PGAPSSSGVFCRHVIFLPSSWAALTTAVRRLRTTLWLAAHTPTCFPLRTRSRIMRAPVKVLPEPGGPWIASAPWSSASASRRAAVHARQFQLALLADGGVLSGEPIAVHGHASRADTFDELEAREPGVVFEQLIVGHVAQPEVLPPGRLLLSPVPVEHVGEQP